MTTSELKGLMKGAGRGATWLAEQLGVSRALIYLWLNGETPIPEARAQRVRELLPPVPTPKEEAPHAGS